MTHPLSNHRLPARFAAFRRHVRQGAQLAGLTLALTLAGCGGDGSSAPNPPPVDPPVTPPVDTTVDVAQLQGRWATAVGVLPGFTTLVLPARSGSATSWVLAQDASTLSRLTLTGGASLAATGKAYPLSGSGLGQYVTPVATVDLNANPKTLSLTQLAVSPIQMSLRDSLAGPASQADTVGQWTASAGNQRLEVRWNVSAAGVVTGSSNTGCVWSGSVTAMVDAKAYTAQIRENCAGSVSDFAGVATLSPDKSSLSVASTMVDDSRALVMLFGR